MGTRTHDNRGLVGIAGAARLLAAVLLLAACSKVPGVYVVERDGDAAAAAAAGGGPFDAAAYVEGIWGSKVLPTLESQARPAAEVLAAIAGGAESAGATYGRQAGAGSPYTFTVSGTATVVAVDAESAVGVLSIDVAPADGTADLRIAIGPALLGTSLRDALPFIDFSQFTNQLDYADVATALNARVKTTVLAGLDAAAAQGRTVTFLGAFSATGDAQPILVPARLEVGS